MQFLRREQRKTFFQIETHLMTEHAFRACAGAVRLHGALFQNAAEKILVLFHRMCFCGDKIVFQNSPYSKKSSIAPDMWGVGA